MGKREEKKPDGAAPFGSSPADWAIPGVDRGPVPPEPVAAQTVTPESAARPRRLTLPASDDLPVVADGVQAPEVLAGLELIRRGVALVHSGSTAGFTASQKRAFVEAVARVRSSVDAGYLMALGELDADPEAVPSATKHVGCTFLKHRLRFGSADAARDVAAARTLFGDGAGLPLIGAALAAGEIARAHADVAVKCLSRIPRHLREQVDEDGVTGAAKVDEYLVEQSRTFAPSTTELLARQVLAMLDPDGTDRYDPKAYERRSFTYRTDSTGMLVGKFQLAPAEGAVVRAAIEAMLKAGRARVEGQTEDGQAVLFGDERTLTQQRADAVTAICAAYLRGGSDSQTSVAAPSTRVVVVATPEQVAAARAAIPPRRDGNGDVIRPPGAPPGPPAGLATEVSSGPLDPGAFGRLLCDAIEQTVLVDENLSVLYLGRTTRLASATQRIALIARDRGCVVPGCRVPPGGCQAHHVVWWRHGGTTDIDNLALLCERHHTLVHTGDWLLEIRDGIPWVTPPAWVDPERRPIRNTVFSQEQAAQRLGQSLRTGRQPTLGDL